MSSWKVLLISFCLFPGTEMWDINDTEEEQKNKTECKTNNNNTTKYKTKTTMETIRVIKIMT